MSSPNRKEQDSDAPNLVSIAIRYLPIATLIVTTLALFLTKSRGGLIAALAGVGVTMTLLVLLQKQSADNSAVTEQLGERASFAKRALTLTVAVLVIVFITLLFGSQTIFRFSEDGIDTARLCVYGSSLQAFQERYLFGHGLGTFEYVFPTYREVGCGGINSVFIRAHNFYIEGLFSLGLVFVILLGASLIRILQVLRAGFKRDENYWFLPALGIGVLVLLSVHSVVDFSVQIPGVALYAASLLAAIANFCLPERRRS